MQQESNNSSASSSLSVPSPSFTTNSAQNLADIAARVVHELNLSPDDLFLSPLHQNNTAQSDDDVEPEFEFALLSIDDTSSPITADDIFHNGQIKPIYPLFNTDLIHIHQNDAVSEIQSETARNAELEGVPHETYCVWAPNKKQENNNNIILKKKSNSTGTGAGEELSKRWRLRDLLLNRSHSDGKDNFVLLPPPSPNHPSADKKMKGKVTAVKNIYSYGGGKKKKTYLTYRPELVGFFW